ncbi:hypothetical protein F5H01DRAFT_342308 [Linnemannia elongata]|nr:hypothetical protein F5H01DRAFT_342308 [Linnemannia elongata]
MFCLLHYESVPCPPPFTPLILLRNHFFCSFRTNPAPGQVGQTGQTGQKGNLRSCIRDDHLTSQRTNQQTIYLHTYAHTQLDLAAGSAISFTSILFACLSPSVRSSFFLLFHPSNILAITFSVSIVHSSFKQNARNKLIKPIDLLHWYLFCCC